jgi:5-methylcytosine-specific restriction endonuclease McrA
MSFDKFKTELFKHAPPVRAQLITFFRTWMKNKDNIASLTPPTIAKKHKQNLQHKPQHNQQHNHIPKLIRGKVWKNYHGTSITGSCYCCKRELDAFDAWHAGHIISRAHGGPDTPSNLRPVCPACNISMGTQNMDEYKQQYYPEDTVVT